MAIPVFKPSYTNEEYNAVKKVMQSGWVGLGPKTQEFEQKFARYIGVKYAVAVNSCTSALFLALHLADIRGREVITTPLTFISTNHTILHNGGIPVFADIEQDTLCIDPASIEKRITNKTKAIMVVHYGGHACDMDRINRLARKHRLLVIEDAAHGCGGMYKGKKLGSLGRFGCFSFHAVKNLATGEGGMVTTNSKAAYNHMKRLRWLGITKDTWSRGRKAKYDWYYNIPETGFKLHMNDIPASIGVVQLKKLDRTNGKRRQLVKRYNRQLRNLSGLRVPVEKKGVKSACHNYVIKTDKRDQLVRYLKERGISTGVHYIPSNHYPMYRTYPGRTPVCEDIWKQLVTLPLFPDLTIKDQDRIIMAIKLFYK